jgi:hypothetical protein
VTEPGPREPSEPTEPAPRHPARNRGTHAAPPSPARLLVRSLFAVAAVGLVVALLVMWRGSPTTSTADSGPGPAVVSPSMPAALASSTPTPKEVLSPSAGPTIAAPTPKPTRVVGPLFVANNTRETGKAKRAAAKFHQGGWPISGTGNYRGRRIAETTVYYTPGNAQELAAAQSLHEQFPQVKAVAPRFAGLPGHGLVVVLTADFPD